MNRTKRSKEPDQDAKGFWPYKPQVIVDSSSILQSAKGTPTLVIEEVEDTEFKIAGQEGKGTLLEHLLCAN